MNITINLQFLSNLTQAIELQNNIGYLLSVDDQVKHPILFRMAPKFEQRLAYARLD